MVGLTGASGGHGSHRSGRISTIWICLPVYCEGHAERNLYAYYNTFAPLFTDFTQIALVKSVFVRINDGVQKVHLTANWICRDGVDVDVMRPADATRPVLLLNRSNSEGTWKFG